MVFEKVPFKDSAFFRLHVSSSFQGAPKKILFANLPRFGLGAEQTLICQDGFQQSEDFIPGPQCLCYDIIAAGQERCCSVLIHVVFGKNDYDDGRMVPADPLDQFESVMIMKLDVQEENIRADILKERQAFLAVRCLPDVNFRKTVVEYFVQRLPKKNIIINKHYSEVHNNAPGNQILGSVYVFVSLISAVHIIIMYHENP